MNIRLEHERNGLQNLRNFAENHFAAVGRVISNWLFERVSTIFVTSRKWSKVCNQLAGGTK